MTTSHVCECGNAKHWNAHACTTCAEMEAINDNEPSPAEVLETRLSHDDWIAVDDLYDSLDLGEHDRPRFSMALSRLIKIGRVERQRVSARWGRYKGGVTQVRLVQRKRRAA